MAVIFKAAWNGFSVGQVSTLPDAEESRLIEAGVCEPAARKAGVATGLGLDSPQRPFLLSLGDSINAQDVPLDLGGGMPGASPAFWSNALCAGAFDVLGPYESVLTPSGGSQTSPQPIRNGMWGSSGALVQQAIKFVLPGFLKDIKPRVGGRPWAVLLSGGINDLSNTDVVGFDAALFADYRRLLEKIIDCGGFPIVKIREPSVFMNTPAKKQNREAFASRVLSFAAGRNDLAVADIERAWGLYGRGLTLASATRGVVGDGVHPNLQGSILHGFAVRDALIGGPFRLCPPWVRADFKGVVNGTIAQFGGVSGGKGPNSDPASIVPTGWTLGSFGAGTVVNMLADGGGGVPGVRLFAQASAGVVSDRVGLASTAAPSVVANGPVYRAFVDMDVIRASHFTGVSFQVRTTGSVFIGAGLSGSSDRKPMSDATALAPACPSAANLLEGQRVVLATMPFRFPAAPLGTIHDVGGGADGFTAPTGRLETQTRFAGLVEVS